MLENLQTIHQWMSYFVFGVNKILGLLKYKFSSAKVHQRL